MKTASVTEQHAIISPQTNCYLHRGLMVASIACGILSLVPTLRPAAALGARSVALLSSLATATAQESKEERLLAGLKFAIITTGLIGVAIASPMVVVASVIADMAFQLFEIIRALHAGNFKKAAVHLGTLAIDGLVLGAMITGSWQLMAASAAITAAVMVGLMIKSGIEFYKTKDAGKLIDTIGYAALATLGINNTCAAVALQPPAPVIPPQPPVHSDFSFTNTADHSLEVYGERGNFAQWVDPGQTVHVTLPDTERLMINDPVLGQQYYDPNDITIYPSDAIHTDYTFTNIVDHPVQVYQQGGQWALPGQVYQQGGGLSQWVLPGQTVHISLPGTDQLVVSNPGSGQGFADGTTVYPQAPVSPPVAPAITGLPVTFSSSTSGLGSAVYHRGTIADFVATGTNCFEHASLGSGAKRGYPLRRDSLELLSKA